MPDPGPHQSWWQRPLGGTGWHALARSLDARRHLFEGLQAQPSEVYAAITTALTRRGIPDLALSEIIYREAGYFSGGRAYLRVSREHHVFDICAAPFGGSFFVSWRLAEARPAAFWPTLAALLYGGLTYAFFLEFFELRGALWGALLFLAAFLLLGAVVTQTAGERWVQYVLVIPGLGWLLERLFLPPTYFRLDTAAMFGESVKSALREVLDEMTKTKGIRPLTDDDWKPRMQI